MSDFFSIHDWLALDEIGLTQINSLDDPCPVYHVTDIGGLKVHSDECREHGICPHQTDCDDCMLPTCLIEVEGSGRLLRLPVELANWVKQIRKYSSCHGHLFPAQIAFGRVKNRVFAEIRHCSLDFAFYASEITPSIDSSKKKTMFLSDLSPHTVYVIDQQGKTQGPFRCTLTSWRLCSFESEFKAVPGDFIVHALPDGELETYVVTEFVFSKAIDNIPEHSLVRILKQAIPSEYFSELENIQKQQQELNLNPDSISNNEVR